MYSPVAQRIITILCLFAFGIGQMVLARHLVRCTDGSGETRIELVCNKSSTGGCVTDAEHATEITPQVHESSPEAPCQDEPIGQQMISAVLGNSASIAVELIVSFAALVVLDWATSFASDYAITHPVVAESARPPDVLSQIRTVVRLV